jgi:hypothetical protein
LNIWSPSGDDYWTGCNLPFSTAWRTQELGKAAWAMSLNSKKARGLLGDLESVKQDPRVRGPVKGLVSRVAAAPSEQLSRRCL